jgi:peptide/nickel transport system substrate-binding protein
VPLFSIRLTGASAFLALLVSALPLKADEVRSVLMDQHRGGSARMVSTSAEGTIDPHVNYTLTYWMIYQSVYSGLVAFPKGAGADSMVVVPDLAEAMPTISNDGKTYTFKLRQGIKFSNGKELTTDDVLASFQRIFKVFGPTSGTFYQRIVGADACLDVPETCTLDGGVVVDKASYSVTINLTEPDAEFLFKLAVPHASILPSETPPRDVGTEPIPGTGPYMLEAYDPNKSLTWIRNPHFSQWSEAAQPDGYIDTFTLDFGLTEEAQINAIINGQADYMIDAPPADRLGELGTRYTDQVHVNQQAALWYIPLNVNLPPFDNLKARQALAYAVDLNAAANIFGGPKLVTPTCQILPKGFPGYQPFCLYTKTPGDSWTGPDMDKALELVEESGTKGQKVTVVVKDTDISRNLGLYLQSLLTQLGYDASVNSISGNIYDAYIQNTNNKVQISLNSWYQDYPAAANFLNVLLGCASFRPGSDSSQNISGFCDPAIQRMMDEAMALALTDQVAADRLWSEVDRTMMENVPVVPLFNPSRVDFLSKRVGNYMFSPLYQWVYANAWVKE